MISRLLTPPRCTVFSWSPIAVTLAAAASLTFLSMSHPSRPLKVLSESRKKLVGSIVYFHFAALLATMFWIWIFPPSADWIFISYTLVRTLSYMFFENECIIGFLEKKLMNPAYVLGSDPHDEPYVVFLPRTLQWLFIALLLTLMPYMILVTFMTFPSSLPINLWRLAFVLPFLLLVLSGFWKFAVIKMNSLNSTPPS